MRRFEIEDGVSGCTPIAVIDANVGDVMYIREEGKIVAVKYVSASLAFDKYGELQGVCHFIKADSGTERQAPYFDSYFYRSVEDCRRRENVIESILLDPALIAKDAGFEDFKIKGGMPAFEMYEWDGYYPRKVDVGMKDFHFEFDGKSWSFRSIRNGNYYCSFEECEADNHVEVVLFPED